LRFGNERKYLMVRWIYVIVGGFIFFSNLFNILRVSFLCITLPYEKWHTEAVPGTILLLIISFQILKSGIQKFKKVKIETEIIDRFEKK